MRPREGCDTASPRRLHRGRDVLTEDGAAAVDTRQVSAVSDTVVSHEIHMKSEFIPTVLPKLAAASQAASEVVQPRPRDSGYMDLLPPMGECIESLGIDTPDAVVSGISVGPDVLQTAVSVTTVVSEKWMERFAINLDVLCSDGSASGDELAGGSSDVGSDVCVVLDPLLTAVSVRTVVAEK